MSLQRITVAAALALAGCLPKGNRSALPADALQTTAGQYLAGQDCDPLVPTQCGFPMPSNVYLVHEKDGVHVEFGKRTLPVAGGNYTDPVSWFHSDGFSPGNAAMTHMPGATITWANGTNGTLPTPDSIGDSLKADCPTVIIEADNGTVVPHWVDLDQSTTDGSDDTEHTFIIRPAIRLKDSTRYIVAIRSLVDKNGAALPPTPVFQALRDGKSSTDPTVAPRQALYADIFSKLKKAGVDQSSLQLAWDFTTSSKENNTAALISMRDQALAVVGADGPSYTTDAATIPSPDALTCTIGAGGCNGGFNCINGKCLDSVAGIVMNPTPGITMRIEGTFHVPLYLSQPNPPQQPTSPPCRICRDSTCSPANFGDSTKIPVQNGFADYPYEVEIPDSVAQSGTTAPILLNGHGLLGSRHEGDGGYLARFDNDKKYVSVAINLTGFDGNAVPEAENSVQGDIGAFLNMIDPQQQGIVNQILVIRMLKGAFAKDPRFFFNAAGQPDPTGHSVIDTTTAFYRGDSQGGIMGAAYMAVAVDTPRGYLGEPGMPYSLLLNRSLDFAGYFALLSATYTAIGGRDMQIVLGLMQMIWDRSEPTGFAPYMTENMLPCASCAGGVTPSHTVIIDDAIGDFQVTPFAAAILARTVGAKNTKPVNREIYGIEDADGPFTGSSITEFNFHLDANSSVKLPIVNVANNGPDSCDPHDNVREESPVFDQTDLFFRMGQAQNFCSGALLGIDATTGSCTFDWTMGPTPENLLANTTPVACNPG